MRRFHLSTGLLGVAIFLVTGQFMLRHQPPMAVLRDAARLMLRSRHIYILASALINLMLGLYLQRQPAGWREIARIIGSALLLGSTALLIVAFLVEPERGFQPEMLWSRAGLYTMFLGCMVHLVSSLGNLRLRPGPSSN
jgi:hypothetical protein